MELRDHLLYLKRSAIYIIIFAGITSATAGLVSWRTPPSYKTIAAFEVQLVHRGPTTDYQYGSYYDLKGAEIFTQHLMSILRSPAVIGQIYDQAQLPYTIDNLNRFTNQFRTDQDSAQQFTVTFSPLDRTTAEKLAAAMAIVLQTRAQAASHNEADEPLFVLEAHTPVIIYEQAQPGLAAAAGAAFGVCAGVVLVYLKRYLSAA